MTFSLPKKRKRKACKKKLAKLLKEQIENDYGEFWNNIQNSMVDVGGLV